MSTCWHFFCILLLFKEQLTWKQKSLLGLVNKNIFMLMKAEIQKHQNCHKSIYIHLYSNNGKWKIAQNDREENILIINVSVIPLIINQLDKKKVERKKRKVFRHWAILSPQWQFTIHSNSIYFSDFSKHKENNKKKSLERKIS